APTRRAGKAPFTLLAGRIWDAAKNIALADNVAIGDAYLAGEQQHPDGGHAATPRRLIALGQLTRAEMDVWLARASIYLSPARYDPFGLLPLQAALHGCALLLSDIPSYRELWNGAATFFQCDDADHLRSQWEALSANPAPFGERARARALTYTVERMTCAYEALYACDRVAA